MFARLSRRTSVVHHRFLSMGTLITVTICCDRRARQQNVDDALRAVQGRMDAFARDWWAWGDGRLAQVNRRLASGGAAEIPHDMRPLFERAWRIHLDTGGMFEPRIASLVRLWGFDDMARLRAEPPSRAEIEPLVEALRRAPPYHFGAESYGPAPSIGWDFGAIGKGYIVDECLDLLGRLGFSDASIDAGGNLAVRGRRVNRPWRIGIRDPRGGSTEVLIAVLDACDESVITHGDDQRFFEHDGTRYAHILDPRSGMPARGLRSLTVAHPDAAFADAAGSALFASGLTWPALARRLDLREVMAVTSEGDLLATSSLAARLATQSGRIRIVG